MYSAPAGFTAGALWFEKKTESEGAWAGNGGGACLRQKTARGRLCGEADERRETRGETGIDKGPFVQKNGRKGTIRLEHFRIYPLRIR